MRFTSQEEYGLRCMLHLARKEDRGPISIEEIAKGEGLTPHYVGKLMRILLKGGLVKSIRGQNGGYTLSKPAVQMGLDEVISVLDGRFFEQTDCTKFTGQHRYCAHSTECSVRSLWSTIDDAINMILSHTKLKDLIGGERQVFEWLRYGEPAQEKESVAVN